MNNVKEFLEEYNELTEKYRMHIGPKLKDYRIAALELVVNHPTLPTECVDIGPVLEEGKWIMGVNER